MNNIGRWAWGHVQIALPTIVVIAVVKFIMSHNEFLAAYRNDI